MTTTLERNLDAIRLRQPALSDLLGRTQAREDVRLVPAGDGTWSGTLGAEGRALASLRRPRDEAARWAAGVEVTGAGAFVVPGFGIGAHVEALRRRLGPHGVIIAFEPDLGLLRAVLEQVDCAPWLSSVTIAHDPADTAGLAGALKGLEPLVALGVALLEHPPSAARVGGLWGQFGATVAQLVRATRTNVATSLVHSDTTLRNLLMNIDAYATGPGIEDLRGAAAGRPAVVVSAGPSLARNVDLLASPGVRDRVVIIAVQTVLKTLLARGIRPHFVTALDHHEMSRRFYEGLRPADVAGVELIAEAKVNAAVTQAFPGVIRFPADERLDQVLGPEFARPRGRVEPGATVAHLAYHFARHLGCDPVILIGQDLGFTLGQYYAAGAAIHDVWGCELGPFRTLETLEWERIARSKGLLSRTTDQRGRAAYTDEQMNAYLVQFERHFADDAARGLRVIDATEGGVRKQHTQAMTLAEALEACADAPGLDLPRGEAARPDAGRLRTLSKRLGEVESQARRVGELCARTLEGLERVRAGDPLGKHQRVIEAARAEVFTLEPAFGLVQFLSQNAALNRYRADRAIALSEGRDARETQALRVERDIANVRWLGEAAERLASLLVAATGAVAGGSRLTRDAEEAAPREASLSIEPARHGAALLWVDPDRGSLGGARSLDAPAGAGCNVLRLTLERLAQARTVGRVILLCDDPERVRAMAGPAPAGLGLDFVQRERPGAPMPARRVASARRWGGVNWRGGPGGLLAHDEVFDAREAASVVRMFNLPGVLVLGADWCLVDPTLTDEIVMRHRSAPDQHRLVFCQAPPGLAPVYVDAGLIQDLAHAAAQPGSQASLGALVGYQPAAPRPDPIAKGACVTIDAALRDRAARFIAGDAASLGAIQQALRPLGARAIEAPASELAPLVHERLAALDDRGPAHLELELCTGRLTSGLLAAWRRGPYEVPERLPASLEGLGSLLRDAARARPDALLTLAGAGDPLGHPHWLDAVRAAREAGIAGVHLRTDLLCDEATCSALLGAPLDVISIDLGAHRPETYARLRGVNGLELARTNVLRLVQALRAGEDSPWIVPRLVKCDDVIGEFEDFYDFWLSRTGACVLDPLPRAVDGLDVRPLPLPERARARAEAAGLRVLSDGSAVLGAGRLAGNVFAEGLAPAWKRIRRERASRERTSHVAETAAA
ncbi:MAG: DUF115 domain-containing protein [Phycisphaerales bacterium]|nr:DUF115 domain-containing protein [Phycisphaerales bacterium]